MYEATGGIQVRDCISDMYKSLCSVKAPEKKKEKKKKTEIISGNISVFDQPFNIILLKPISENLKSW